MPDPIIALSDGRPGHWGPTAGMVEAAQEVTGAPVERIECRLRLKALRPVLGALLPAPAAGAALRLGYRADRPWPQTARLVLSTGGDTLYANALLARLTGAPNLFCGSLRGVDPRHFAAVVTNRSADAPEAIPNAIVLETAPMVRVQRQPSPGGPVLAVLIGGDGLGYRFAPADWEVLGARIGEAVAAGWRVWLTTSRRTGAEAEAILAGHAGAAERVVLWGRKPEKVMGAFLAAADAFLVTPESTTMVTDAVLTGRPVFLAGPAPGHAPARHLRFLDQLQRDGRARPLTGPMPPPAQAADGFQPIERHPVDRLVEAIAALPGVAR